MAKLLVSTGVVPHWHHLNTHIILWHGCINSDAQNIAVNGVDLSKSRNALDFGLGFYTTTDLGQASSWARIKHANLAPDDRLALRPSVIQFRVPLDQLAKLECLTFIRGDVGHNAYWSFVRHCRGSTHVAPRTHLHPTREAPDDWYDLVCGPIAAVWPPMGRCAYMDSDQFSFHTVAGIAILHDVINAGSPAFRVSVL